MTRDHGAPPLALSRRSFVQLGLTTLAACALPGRGAVQGDTAITAAPDGPRPSLAQLRWQRDELAMFLHFGVNTFTDREWGDGHEEPAIFNPTALDAMQWARAARDAGFRALILTAKHHDGFCLWPTATTMHSVKASPWRDGRGDVVREFTDACRATGLRAGLYLSPWDRNHPTYGDSARYNDIYVAQLTELLTHFGPIAEVWFDGANGEGPNGRKQQYDWPRVFGVVRQLQPDAVIFSDAGPDVRWCGNEKGVAGDPNWSTIDPASVPFPGADAPGITDALQHGDPHGAAWRPAEVDVSIRPGWFHHDSENEQVRSADDLMELYFSSVGHNGKLLLNVPPTRAGLLDATDVAHLMQFRAARERLFANDLAAGARRQERANVTTLTSDGPRTIATARLSEDITHGQHVAAYRLEGMCADGSWCPLSQGATIGYAKLDRFAPVAVHGVRLTVRDAVGTPRPIGIRLYA